MCAEDTVLISSRLAYLWLENFQIVAESLPTENCDEFAAFMVAPDDVEVTHKVIKHEFESWSIV